MGNGKRPVAPDVAMSVKFEDEYKLLPIYAPHGLSAADWDAIKRAKASLHLPRLVKPVGAVLGTPGRILAIGAEPDWIDCEYAFIAKAEGPGLVSALEWVLTDKRDARAMNTLKILQKILGPGVREVADGANGQSA